MNMNATTSIALNAVRMSLRLGLAFMNATFALAQDYVPKWVQLFWPTKLQPCA